MSRLPRAWARRKASRAAAGTSSSRSVGGTITVSARSIPSRPCGTRIPSPPSVITTPGSVVHRRSRYHGIPGVPCPSGPKISQATANSNRVMPSEARTATTPVPGVHPGRRRAGSRSMAGLSRTTSIMPLSPTPREAHDAGMPSRPVPPDALRPTPAGRRRRTALKGGRRSAAGAPTTLLLRDEDDPLRLSGRSGRTWERVLARILGPSLDRQLAAGCPPEGNGLLATRAQTLVSPQSRRALAGNWEHLLSVIRPGPEVVACIRCAVTGWRRPSRRSV